MLFQYQNFQLPLQYFVRIFTMSAYKPYLFRKEPIVSKLMALE